MAKRNYRDVNNTNYAGQKWTKEDIQRERNSGNAWAGYQAKRENAELDRKAKLTRDERRHNEMSADDNRIKREPVNSNTRRGKYRAAKKEYESVNGEGKEWGEHKYTDKVKTKTGKIRYIYDDTSSTGGNTSHGAKPISNNTMRRAQQEFQRGKTEISNAVVNAREAAISTGHKIDKALWDAANSITQTTTPSVNPTASGSNYVSKQMERAKDIPVSSLFK